MRETATLGLYLLKDFSRSLWVIVPPGVTIALYRVFFLYGSDSAYLATVGGMIMALVCLLTTLLLAGRANRAATYRLLSRVAHRYQLIASVAAGALAVTLTMAVLFLAAILLSGAVSLSAADLLVLAPRWLAILLFVVAFGLHMSHLVSRFGSNWLAYLVLILLLASYQRVEYLDSALLDTARTVLLTVLAPVTTTLLGGAGNAYLANIVITAVYAALLYALAVALFGRKDLLWAE